MMVMLCLTNLINYIDRGIVPGAADKFDAFIAETQGERGVNAYFGALQSAFIVGFSLGSLVVGHLVHSRPPFRLAAYGLFAWCASALAAGLSKSAQSYELLLVARMASGLGEAGFVTVGGPYIQDVAGAAQGRWLGAFYAAIPLGTALGYGYGALIAETWNWSLCFFVEAIAMVPLALCFLFSRDDGSRSFRAGGAAKTGTTGADDDDDAADIQDDDVLMLLEAEEEDEEHEEDTDDDDDDDADAKDGDSSPRRRRRRRFFSKERKDPDDDDEEPAALAIVTPGPPKGAVIGVREELLLCLRQPTFVWVALGYAGYSGSLIGFSTFAPSIVVGLGLWKTMPSASIAFSATIAASGILGTPLGGLALDDYARRRGGGGPSLVSSSSSSSRRKKTRTKQQVPALELSVVFVLLGFLLILGATVAKTQASFVGFLLLGTLPLFAATSPMNVALFAAVPRENRAFGQALGVMIMHAFGDVPTPVVVGALKDKLAPACTLGRNQDHVGDDCKSQQHRLRLIGVGCAFWLIFSLAGYAVALARADRRDATDDPTDPLGLGDDHLGSPLLNDDEHDDDETRFPRHDNRPGSYVSPPSSTSDTTH